MMRRTPICLILVLALAAPAAAQMTVGTLNPKPLPPLKNPNDPKLPAKELFGRKLTPAPLKPRAVGYYVSGCLAGGVALPITGKTWQVMRLSRYRNWGHPVLVSLIERVAAMVPKVAGWPGLLIGDMSQPRGGPMLTGHLSHQVGLDADIWLTPMPNRKLTRREREEMPATNMVAASKTDVNPKAWTHGHFEVLKAAAQDPHVERILVNAAIKKAVCREASENDRATWLNKVRPWWGHNYHFHLRIGCPKGSPHCRSQPPPPKGHACGKALAWWFRDSIIHPPPPKHPPKKRKPKTMANLPAECKMVLTAK